MQLGEATEQYRSHLTAQGLAANTIKNKTQVLRVAQRVWGDIQPGSIRHSHIDRLFSQAGWSPATRNLYLGNLRLFFAWCRSHGYMRKDFDPTTGWRNVRVPQDEKTRIPVEQFPHLLNACSHPRDRAIVALGLFTFLRGSEIRTLRVTDLDLRSHSLHIYRHKTQQSDTLPVCRELADEMRTWLGWYKPTMGHHYLTPAKKKPRMVQNPRTRRLMKAPQVEEVQPESILTHPYEHVQRALTVLGYEGSGLGVHTLRRSGARAMFDQLRSEGYDGALMRVSSMLGHKDTRVTEAYIGLSLERTQRNELLAGENMFGDVFTRHLEVVNGGSRIAHM